MLPDRGFNCLGIYRRFRFRVVGPVRGFGEVHKGYIYQGHLGEAFSGYDQGYNPGTLDFGKVIQSATPRLLTPKARL